MTKNLKRKPIPLYMVDVLNAYQVTGRVVTVFPYVGKMSLLGFPPVPYDEAHRTMSALLEVLGVQP